MVASILYPLSLELTARLMPTKQHRSVVMAMAVEIDLEDGMAVVLGAFVFKINLRYWI